MLQTQEKTQEFMDRARLLTAKQVLEIWPMARETLSRLTHTTDESRRIPCVMIGRKPYYPYDELMYYRENHRYIPTRKKAKS